MADMMLTGRLLNAAEGEREHIVRYVVPAGKALDKARELAALIARNTADTNWRITNVLPRINDLSHDDGLFVEYLTSISRAHRKPRNACATSSKAAPNRWPPLATSRTEPDRDHAPHHAAIPGSAGRRRIRAHCPGRGRKHPGHPGRHADTPDPRSCRCRRRYHGGGIAMALANIGIPVTLIDSSAQGLASGLQRVRDNYAGSVARGRLDAAAMEGSLPESAARSTWPMRLQQIS